MLNHARFAVVVLGLVLAGCGDPVVAKATLAVAIEGSGSVTSSPAGIECGADCTEDFVAGEVITLTAVAGANSTFTGWSGACSGAAACTVTMSAAQSVTATFAVKRFLLTVVTAGNGAGLVTSAPAGIDCGADCTETLAAGTSVTLTAAPSTGSVFTGWSGAGCTGTSTCVVPISAAASVTATFTLTTHALDVVRAGNGAGTVTSDVGGIQCGATCTASYDYGTMVTLTAAADSSSTFTGWSGGGCSGTGTCVVPMTAAASVTATFTLQQYALTVTLAGAGSGAVSSTPAGINCGSLCAGQFTFGTMVTLTATPGSTSTFAGWSGGGCTGTGACVVTVAAATSVTATFSRIQFPVTVTSAGTGSGTITSAPAGIDCGSTCSQSFDVTTPVTLTATPAVGSVFTGWSGAGCSGTGTCQVTVSAATSVTATFTIAVYDLSVTVGGAGAGSVSSVPAGITCGSTCTGSFAHGTSVTLTAVADSTSAFIGWAGACTGTGTCTISMTAATSVTASFIGRGRFFTMRDTDRMLRRFDWSTTSAPVDVGVVSTPYSFGDLAWNTTNGTLYLVDGRNTNSLYTVDLTTGTTTLVGVHGLTDMFALAYHPPTNALYGVSDGKLYRLSTTTGAATLIGTSLGTLAGTIDGMAWDSARNRLVGITPGALSAYAIDTTTGTATLIVGPLASNNNLGMTYDASADAFVVTDYGGYVVNLDPVTFARTPLASGLGAHTGIAWVP